MQRSVDKFVITLDLVAKRSNLKRKGWDYILNKAWDYSLDSDAIAAGSKRSSAPYTDNSLLTEDQKALLLAFDDLSTNTGFTADEKKSDVTITSTFDNLKLYGFTPLWLMEADVNGPMIDELQPFAVFLKAKYSASLTSELLAGNRVREMYAKKTTADSTKVLYNEMTEY